MATVSSCLRNLKSHQANAQVALADGTRRLKITATVTLLHSVNI